MADPVARPYGTWTSPISAETLAAGARSFQQIALDGQDIYWCEIRPAEAGRYVVMRWSPDGGIAEVTPAGFSAQTLVNSYGGGSFAVHAGTVFATNAAKADFPDTRDQRVYRTEPGMIPQPITPRIKAFYADFAVDARRGLIFAVREDGAVKQNGQNKQSIVALDPDGRRLPVTIAEGADLYAAPRLSPDGRRLAWIQWDYPSMPWEGTELWVAELGAGGTPISTAKIAGAPARDVDPALNPVLQDLLRYSGESILQPLWSPDGTLFFVSDRFGAEGDRWWAIHRHVDGRIAPVTEIAAEFAAPPWRLGGASYGFLSEREILCTYTTAGLWRLARVDIATGAITDIDLGGTSFAHVHVGAGFAALVAGGFERPAEILRLDLESWEATPIRSANPDLGPEARACLAAPEPITFATGKDGAEQAHAFFHPPNNPDFRGPEHERPPLLIFIHGGPTGAAASALSLDIAFFTSRGFAVVDVNYRGSTGFGRRYRQRIYGAWGVVDVEDCVAVAHHLIGADRIDRYRVASRGGSSGGYTTLALATFTDLLTAAASYYGISDLEMIARFTDKLEAHYAELLVGPMPAAQKTFKARSPLYHAGRIDCPLILFQGLDDPVVPPPQARVLIDAMMQRKLPVAWTFYAHEEHGFKIKANVIDALEQELAFYGAIMGFVPAGRLAAPDIRNWGAPDDTAG